jgi:glutamine synthetase
VLAGPKDTASRIENRVGEPAANPYLFILSQVLTGIEGINRKLDPGPPDTDPYSAPRPMLPKSLSESLSTMERELLFRKEFGELFIDYYVKLKRTELNRYAAYVKDCAIDESNNATTEWEQNEYFDFF